MEAGAEVTGPRNPRELAQLVYRLRSLQNAERNYRCERCGLSGRFFCVAFAHTRGRMWMRSAMNMQQSTVYAEILTSIAYTLQEQGDVVAAAVRSATAEAVCFVYTCQRLIDLSLIAGAVCGGGAGGEGGARQSCDTEECETRAAATGKRLLRLSDERLHSMNERRNGNDHAGKRPPRTWAGPSPSPIHVAPARRSRLPPPPTADATAKSSVSTAASRPDRIQ